MKSACGGAGMSITDFWDHSLRDIVNVINGDQDRQLSDLKWMRWQTAALINIHLGRKERIKAVDLFRTGDEEQPESVKVDPKIEQEISSKWDAEMASKFNVNGK